MDGNGRWAKERNLPRREGHRAGAEAVQQTIEACTELKVDFLTLYAFSSENFLWAPKTLLLDFVEFSFRLRSRIGKIAKRGNMILEQFLVSTV